MCAHDIPSGHVPTTLSTKPETFRWLQDYTRTVYVDVMPTETADAPPGIAAPPAGLDLRDSASIAYLDSVNSPDGALTGKQLGVMFDRSERWGRDIIAALTAANEVPPPLPTAGTLPADAAAPPAADTAAPPLPPLPPTVTTRKRAAPGSRKRGNGKPRVATAVPRATAAAVPTAAAPAAAAPRWWQRIDGGRVVAWSGFVFGSAMSVAANVLYTWLPADKNPDGWHPPYAQQVGAAVWPIALLLSVEVLSRVQWRNVWYWNIARYGGAGLVAAASGIISYVHLNEVLTRWNYGDFPSLAGPVVLDGLMIVSGFALLAMATPHTDTPQKESA